jgi:galactonate dehydratase
MRMSYSVIGYTLQATPKTLWSFIKLTSDDGFIGWGEFTIRAPREKLSKTLHEVIAGLTEDDFELDGPRKGPGLLGQPVQSAIYTAIDQAVFDITAQRKNIKLVQLLAPDNTAETVTLYANINRSVVERTPEAFALRALEATADGFNAIKMAPFDDLTPELCQTDEGRKYLAAGADRIQAVRDAIGPDVSLMVDCHWRMDVKTAHEALEFLTNAGVSWYECPLPETVETIDSLLELRSKANDLGMRLAGCETFTGWKDFAPFVEKSVYDVIMPDAKYVGSMREIISVGERAMKHGVAVSLHNPSGPISHAVSLHIAMALNNGMPLEFQFNETPLFDEIASGTIPPRTGQSNLPSGSGTGIGLVETKLTPLL